MPELDTVWTAWKNHLAAHRETGAAAEGFPFAPAALRLLDDESLAERAFRRGAVLLEAEEGAVAAWLAFRGRVFGVYAQQGPGAEADAVMRDMAEFRLGWLPDEAVKNAGGLGAAFAVIPPEAEGFPLIFITGNNRDRFAGRGKIIAAPPRA